MKTSTTGKGFGKGKSNGHTSPTPQEMMATLNGINFSKPVICTLFMDMGFPVVDHLTVEFDFTEDDLKAIGNISETYNIPESLVFQELNMLAINESHCAKKHSKTVPQWRQMGFEWLERQTVK